MPTTASRIRIHRMRTILLADAEGAKNQVQDVVRGGRAGDFIEWAEGAVEVEEEHFVRDTRGNGIACGREGGKRVTNEFLVANIGQETGFDLRAAFSAHMLEDRGAQFRDAFAGQGRSVD